MFFISLIVVLVFESIHKMNILGPKFNVKYESFIMKSYYDLFFIFFIINLFIIMILGYFDINIFNQIDFEKDLTNYMSGNQGSNSSDSSKITSVNTSITDGTVNVNTPHVNVNLSQNALTNISAAISSSGGAALAVKVAQSIPGTPATKLAAATASMLGVQATTVIVSKA
jgi:hypothetical protein